MTYHHNPVGDIVYHQAAGTDDTVPADVQSRQDRGSGSDPGAISQADETTESGARGKLTAVTEDALVVHGGPGIDDDLGPEYRFCSYQGPRH